MGGGKQARAVVQRTSHMLHQVAHPALLQHTDSAVRLVCIELLGAITTSIMADCKQVRRHCWGATRAAKWPSHWFLVLRVPAYSAACACLQAEAEEEEVQQLLAASGYDAEAARETGAGARRRCSFCCRTRVMGSAAQCRTRLTTNRAA